MDSIGRYEVKEMLGSGAMADVYLAFDPKINRTLAIKLLKSEHASNDEYRFRFLREASAAGNLVHPKIVTVYDVGEVDEHPYMAMELLSGNSLEDLMEANHEFSIPDVLEIGIQVADALHYSHSQGVVHRDIKPANIVCAEGGTQVKITDFGIAHVDDTHNSQQTQMGAILGTPQYMAPEQLRGEKIDGRADLFATGILLYQLLTHEKPFTGNTLASLFLEISNGNYVHIEHLVADIPPRLARIVSRLLQKKPGRRYQTGEELSMALQQVKQELTTKDESVTDSQVLMSIWSVAKSTIQTSFQWIWISCSGALLKLLQNIKMTPEDVLTDVDRHQRNSLKKHAVLKKRTAFHKSQVHIPFRVWGSVSMMLAVGFTLVICSTVVYFSQLNTMRSFALDSGSALAKLISINSAEAMLGEDWITIETLIEDLKDNQEFSYIFIADHKNTVRGSSEETAVNLPIDIKGLPTASTTYAEAEIRDWLYEGTQVFDFAVAIKFQQKSVGKIHIGLSQSHLANAANTTLWTMGLLIVITVISVVGMTYLLISRITKPIALLQKAIKQTIAGHADYTLDNTRNDEFGEVFKSFNALLDKNEKTMQALMPDAGESEKDDPFLSENDDDDKTVLMKVIGSEDETLVMSPQPTEKNPEDS